MTLHDLVLKNRSYRRFYEDIPLQREHLLRYLNTARNVASGANLQPLKYFLSCEAELNQKIFNTLHWAGQLKEWPGPETGERPTAYIIVLGDNTISKKFETDLGIVGQTVLLSAVENGFGGCILTNIKRDALRLILSLEERYSIVGVIALGKPKEKVILETTGDKESTRYWRDENGGHHVPKRELKELVIN